MHDQSNLLRSFFLVHPLREPSVSEGRNISGLPNEELRAVRCSADEGFVVKSELTRSTRGTRAKSLALRNQTAALCSSEARPCQREAAVELMHSCHIISTNRHAALLQNYRTESFLVPGWSSESGSGVPMRFCLAAASRTEEPQAIPSQRSTLPPGKALFSVFDSPARYARCADPRLNTIRPNWARSPALGEWLYSTLVGGKLLREMEPFFSHIPESGLLVESHRIGL